MDAGKTTHYTTPPKVTWRQTSLLDHLKPGWTLGGVTGEVPRDAETPKGKPRRGRRKQGTPALRGKPPDPSQQEIKRFFCVPDEARNHGNGRQTQPVEATQKQEEPKCDSVATMGETAK